MKILAIHSAFPDIGYEQLTEGLCLTLGNKNVHVWCLAEPPPWGGSWYTNRELNFVDTPDQVYDAVIFSHHLDGQDLARRISTRGLTVFFDDSDRYTCEPSSVGFDLAFKREMLIYGDYPPNYYPMPLCIPSKLVEIFSNEDFVKQHFVNLSWKNTTEYRRKFHKKLFETVRSKGWDVFGQLDQNGETVPYYQNLANMKNSLISVVPNSQSVGCGMLFWESVASGSCTITNNYGVRIPYPFLHDKHVIYFFSEMDSPRILSELIDKPDICDQVGRSGRDHALKFHTSLARAEYALSIIQKHFKT